MEEQIIAIPSEGTSVESPMIYTIWVIGCLEKSWSARLSGFHILKYPMPLNEGIEMTTLTGELVDNISCSNNWQLE